MPTSKCNETLCWTCRCATGTTIPHHLSTSPNGLFRCPWAADYKPVPDWEAEPKKLKIKPDETIDSYMVLRCPFYLPDLEAKINALSTKEIARRLEISTSFVNDHKKICKQVLYTYTKQYHRYVEADKKYAAQLTTVLGTYTKPQKPDATQRYKMKRDIVKELLIFSQGSLRDLETSDDSSQDGYDYAIQLRQSIKDCEDLLKNLEFHYKRNQIKKAGDKE